MFRHLFFFWGFKLKASLRKRKASVRQRNAGIGRKEKHHEISFKLLKCLRRMRKLQIGSWNLHTRSAEHTDPPSLRIWICFYTFSSLLILPQFRESKAPVKPLGGVFPFASVHTKCNTNQPHTDSGSTPLDLVWGWCVKSHSSAPSPSPDPIPHGRASLKATWSAGLAYVVMHPCAWPL